MNGWAIAAIILILICICAAISSNEETTANAAKKALEQDKENAAREASRSEQERLERTSARRPEAMTAMLREEFPQFTTDFTYARSKAILDWYQSRGASAREAAMRNSPGDAPALLGMLFSRECAPIVSDAFAAYAAANPQVAWNRVVMCVEGSAIRAHGM